MFFKKLTFRIILKPSLRSNNVIYGEQNKTNLWAGCGNFCSSAFLSPDFVLSETNKKNFLDLCSSTKSSDVKNDKKLKKAAVLVPLCEVNKQLALLYTVRAMHLKVNGGEVAFPGGMFEESDGSLEATALRENYEEIGIKQDDVDVWGQGPEVVGLNAYVTPILGYIGCINLQKLKINTNEVSEAFVVTLERLSSSSNFKHTKFRYNKTCTFKSPVYLGGEQKIWGLTARITHIILSSLIPNYYLKNIQFKTEIQRILLDPLKKKKINELV